MLNVLNVHFQIYLSIDVALKADARFQFIIVVSVVQLNYISMNKQIDWYLSVWNTM